MVGPVQKFDIKLQIKLSPIKGTVLCKMDMKQPYRNICVAVVGRHLLSMLWKSKCMWISMSLLDYGTHHF